MNIKVPIYSVETNAEEFIVLYTAVNYLLRLLCLCCCYVFHLILFLRSVCCRNLCQTNILNVHFSCMQANMNNNIHGFYPFALCKCHATCYVRYFLIFFSRYFRAISGIDHVTVHIIETVNNDHTSSAKSSTSLAICFLHSIRYFQIDLNKWNDFSFFFFYSTTESVVVMNVSRIDAFSPIHPAGTNKTK